MSRKNIVIGIVIAVLVVGGLCAYSYTKNERVKETVASIIKGQFEKIEMVSDVSVSDVIYSKVQGNSYVGSAKVDFMNGLYGTRQARSVSYDMVCDGKTVFVTIKN